MAQFYLNKINSSNTRNIDFEISIVDVRTLLSRKLCTYSGLEMTHRGCGQTKNDARFSDVTLERIDNSKAYTKENIIAICYGFNNLKSTYENDACSATFKHLFKFVDTLKKLGVK